MRRQAVLPGARQGAAEGAVRPGFAPGPRVPALRRHGANVLPDRGCGIPASASRASSSGSSLAENPRLVLESGEDRIDRRLDMFEQQDCRGRDPCWRQSRACEIVSSRTRAGCSRLAKKVLSTIATLSSGICKRPTSALIVSGISASSKMKSKSIATMSMVAMSTGGNCPTKSCLRSSRSALPPPPPPSWLDQPRRPAGCRYRYPAAGSAPRASPPAPPPSACHPACAAAPSKRHLRAASPGPDHRRNRRARARPGNRRLDPGRVAAIRAHEIAGRRFGRGGGCCPGTAAAASAASALPRTPGGLPRS